MKMSQLASQREHERHALLGVALGLAVERLMLAKLLEQDHRQETGTGPAPGNHMERRRSLADLLAVPAGKLLAHMLDHLPLARDRFQRLGDVLAKLAQPLAAAAKASRRSRHDHPLAWRMLGKGLARGALAPSWSWRPPSRQRSRPRWLNSPTPRTATLSDPESVTCVRSAAHKSGASASRSAVAGGRSGLDRRRPWLGPRRVPLRHALLWRLRR
jgi:hypothetical protein